LRRGSVEGAAVGFASGMLLDLVPPAVGPLGLWAVVLTVLGYLVGLAADDGQRSSITPLVLVGVAALLALATYAGLATVIGQPPISGDDVVRQVPGQVLYTVLLALLVIPALSASIRRFEPSTSRW
jgi:rod shape-determining protein MreD